MRRRLIIIVLAVANVLAFALPVLAGESLMD